MAQTSKVCGFVAVLGLLAVPYASAQAPSPATSKYFGSFNLGGQFASRTFNTELAQTVYDETATLKASLPIGNGLVTDFGGGYKVWDNVFVGMTISFFSDTDNLNYTASIPDPLVTDHFKTVTGQLADQGHLEVAYLPAIIYTRALTDKIDFVGGIGPAIIHLSQDTVTSFTVPSGTQDVNVTAANDSGTGVGVNVSVGANYNVTPRYAVGAYLRYAGAKVELESSPDKVDVGGAQFGVGVRVNF